LGFQIARVPGSGFIFDYFFDGSFVGALREGGKAETY
jgi:hypothetical protein